MDVYMCELDWEINLDYSDHIYFCLIQSFRTDQEVDQACAEHVTPWKNSQSEGLPFAPLNHSPKTSLLQEDTGWGPRFEPKYHMAPLQG